MNHIARRWRYVPAFPQVKGLTFKISLYERLAICHTHRRCFIFIVAIIVRFYICEEFGTEIFRIKHVKEVEDFLADIVRIRNLKGFIAKCENKRRVFVVGLCQFNVANKLVYVLHHTLGNGLMKCFAKIIEEFGRFCRCLIINLFTVEFIVLVLRRRRV